MPLVQFENPFDLSKHRHEYELDSEPRPLAEVLEEKGIEPKENVIVLNGEILPPERALACVAKNGDCIVAYPDLKGGAIRIIGAIAIAAAVAFIPGAWAAAHPLLAALLAVGIQVGGNLLVNFLASMFDPRRSGGAYSWLGPQTSARSGIPIPKGYGTIDTGFNVICSWVDTIGADDDVHDADSGAKDNGRQWLNVIFSGGWGPANSLTNIRINDKDINNYSDIAYVVRLGSNDQVAPMISDAGWVETNITTTGDTSNDQPRTNFDRFVNDYAISQRVRAGVLKNYVIIPGRRWDTDRIDVVVNFPNGVWRYDENKVIKRLAITYNVYYRAHNSGAWILAQQHTYINIRQTLLRQRTVIDGLPRGCYDIKVEKIGSNAVGSAPYQMEWENDNYGDELWIERVQETAKDRLDYPNHILLYMRLMATDQVSGQNIQVKATVDYGLRQTLPTELSGYAQNVPACIAYDIHTDPLIGAGDTNISLDSLVRWAEYTETAKDDGFGGTLPLARFNGVFDQDSKTIWEALQQLGTLGWAIPARLGRTTGFTLDAPDVPVMMFHAGNMIKDSYSKTYLNLEDRAQEVQVNFADAEDDYKTRNPIRVVPSQYQDGGIVIKKNRTDLLGCTSRAQAYYWAYHKLLENTLLIRSHTWRSPVQAITCRVGNVVKLQHDVPGWAYGGGNVQPGDDTYSNTTTQVIIDRDDMPFDGSETYSLTLIFPALLRQTATVSAVSGNTIFVSGYSSATSIKRVRIPSLDIDAAVTSASDGAITVTSPSANLLVQATVTKDAGVLRSTGGLTTGLTNVYATDFIPVVPGKTYAIKVVQVAGNADYGIAYYDAAKVRVGSGPALPWTAGTTFTVPDGVYYIRSTGYYAGVTADLTAQMITEGSDPPSTYTASFLDVLAEAVGETVELWDVDAIEQRAVTGVNGNVVTVGASFPGVPIEDAGYIYSSTTKQALLVRLKNIKRIGLTETFEITAVDYDPAVYDIPTPDAYMPGGAWSGGGGATPGRPGSGSGGSGTPGGSGIYPNDPTASAATTFPPADKYGATLNAYSGSGNIWQQVDWTFPDHVVSVASRLFMKFSTYVSDSSGYAYAYVEVAGLGSGNHWQDENGEHIISLPIDSGTNLNTISVRAYASATFYDPGYGTGVDPSSSVVVTYLYVGAE